MKSPTLKPQDPQAAEIEFGVELETLIPLGANVAIGGYHDGEPVQFGIDARSGRTLAAPQFGGNSWRADKDSSISAENGYAACEFVSPVLRGDDGVAALIQMVDFINRIGGKVNESCGCHVTVGVRSVIGDCTTRPVARFVHKLTALSRQNAWAIYAQTGTDRHANKYSAQLAAELGTVLPMIEAAARREDMATLSRLINECPRRSMINLKKAFLGLRSAIEFRAFAGTLDINKILHHVATSIGLMRRAHAMVLTPAFEKKAPVETGVRALRRLWRVLGWAYCRRPLVAYGLSGLLHSMFADYHKTALEMAKQFDERFPNARL